MELFSIKIYLIVILIFFLDLFFIKIYLDRNLTGISGVFINYIFLTDIPVHIEIP